MSLTRFKMTANSGSKWKRIVGMKLLTVAVEGQPDEISTHRERESYSRQTASLCKVMGLVAIILLSRENCV